MRKFDYTRVSAGRSIAVALSHIQVHIYQTLSISELWHAGSSLVAMSFDCARKKNVEIAARSACERTDGK